MSRDQPSMAGRHDPERQMILHGETRNALYTKFFPFDDSVRMLEMILVSFQKIDRPLRLSSTSYSALPRRILYLAAAAIRAEQTRHRAHCCL
jgi:hypothetical protein